MALKDLTPVRGPAGKQCHVDYTFSLLDDDDADTFAAWLAGDADPSWIAGVIQTETGFRLSRESVWRHRRGSCRCSS